MKKTAKDTSNTQTRVDGWANLITSVGTSRDKRLASRVFWENRPNEEYEQLYAGDELASRIVNCVPEEALRKFVQWTGVDPEIADQVVARCEDLELRPAIEKTWKWGRAYGGACLYIVTDTDKPDLPLQDGERVIALRDLSRYDLRVMAQDIEQDFGKKNFGYPNRYYLSITMGVASKTYPIHHTRMIRFDGYMVPRRTFMKNSFWHDSILNRLFNSIRNYQTSNDAAASVLQDFNVGIYKMKGLANKIAAGQEAQIVKRIDMMAYSKSNIRTMILDADSEEFMDLSRSVDGLAELLTKQANRLVAATDIPHTKLLGESPDGSNATGNSTTAQWFDYIQSQQENYLRPKLQRLLNLIFPELKGQLNFKFKSLYQMTELEEADLRNKTAQTDVAYISAGVLDPSEVAESRFGGETYSIETELDEEARAAGLIGPGSNSYPEGGDDPNGSNPFQDSIRTPSSDALNINFENSNSGPYDLKNEDVPGHPKQSANVSSIMSTPYKPSPYDVAEKAPGTPNKQRVIEPTVGDGVVAPSGGNGKIRPEDLTLKMIKDKLASFNS